MKMSQRASKKAKTEKNEKILQHLIQTYPDHAFRITSHGNVKRKFNNTWLTVCIHNKQLSVCKDESCGGGGALCLHNIPRSSCKISECGGGGGLCVHLRPRKKCPYPSCGGGGSLCEHLIDKGTCKKCGGSQLCKHDRMRSICADPSCGGGGSLCVHLIARTLCREPECGGGGSYCEHDILRTRCPEPQCNGGGALCEHKKVRGDCVECRYNACIHGRKRHMCPEETCGGGTSLCKHKISRSVCRDPTCEGGGSYCKHNKLRYECLVPECEGGGRYCKHLIKRIKCLDPDCGGGGFYCVHLIPKVYCKDLNCGAGTRICVECKIRTKKNGMYCTRCHPDYIPTMSGASKIGCKYICALQQCLNVDIQHIHYEKTTGTITGSEYVLPEWKLKKVDGYYIDSTGKQVIEFLGNYYHGHPSYWLNDTDKKNHYGESHRDNFYDTETKLKKLASFGYVVRYVWECEYRRLKALQSPLSILREFDGTLRY